MDNLDKGVKLTMDNLDKSQLYWLNQKDFVKNILMNAHMFSWTLQGLGMLRLNISAELRLHVWTPLNYKYEDVSEIHNHPWNFYSTIISGQIENFRYHQVALHEPGVLHKVQLIKCGMGGGLEGNAQLVNLVSSNFGEVWIRGNTYHQMANEIHRTNAMPGTVTLVRRQFLPDTEHALVFFDADKKWVSAEPRFAKTEEIRDITGYALDCWRV